MVAPARTVRAAGAAVQIASAALVAEAAPAPQCGAFARPTAPALGASVLT
jgi:hypothetical protein